MTAIDDIRAERLRQIEKEGWTADHDDEHENEAMRLAAACYACHAQFPSYAQDMWPWDKEWWKPRDVRRDLVKAGALIVAEIERLDRIILRNKRAGFSRPPASSD
jgi:hypothetical protein